MTDFASKNEQPSSARALAEAASGGDSDVEIADWTDALADYDRLGDALNDSLTESMEAQNLPANEERDELSLDELATLLQMESSEFIAETYSVVEHIGDDRSIELYADDFIALASAPETISPRADSANFDSDETVAATSVFATAANSANETHNGAHGDSRRNELLVEAAATGPLMAELVAARAEIRRLEENAAQVDDQLTRQQTDFNNYRRRIERNAAEQSARDIGGTVQRLLPVLDNLERVIQAEKKIETERSHQLTDFLLGVEMIYKQFGEILARMGVETVPSLGCAFDPACHEAMITEERPDHPPNTVIEEFQRGYRIGDFLIRPAMVKVTIGKRDE